MEKLMNKPAKATQAAFLTSLLAAGCSVATQQHYPRMAVDDFLKVVETDAALIQSTMQLKANQPKGDSLVETADNALLQIREILEHQRDATLNTPKKDRSKMSPDEYMGEILARLKAQYAQFSRTEREQVDAGLEKLKTQPDASSITEAEKRQELQNTDISAESLRHASIELIQGAFEEVRQRSR